MGMSFLGTEVEVGLEGFFGIEVDVATAGGFVGSDGHEGDVDFVAAADFFEAFEVGAVAGVVDVASGGSDDEAAVVAVGVVAEARSPVMGRGVDHFDAFEGEFFPDGHLGDAFEAELADERAGAFGDHDAVARLDDAQRSLCACGRSGRGRRRRGRLREGRRDEVRAGAGV